MTSYGLLIPKRHRQRLHESDIDIVDAVFLGIAPRPKFLKNPPWLLHLNGDKAPPAEQDSSEVARTQN